MPTKSAEEVVVLFGMMVGQAVGRDDLLLLQEELWLREETTNLVRLN
jgi:hypothetical protein